MEFEKENLKRKDDESKDALKSKYLKNQIFQLDLELSQVTDEDDKKRLEALRNVYVEKLQENKKRRLIRIFLISPLVFLALIILYLVTAFNRETTANNKMEWSPSTYICHWTTFQSTLFLPHFFVKMGIVKRPTLCRFLLYIFIASTLNFWRRRV